MTGTGIDLKEATQILKNSFLSSLEFLAPEKIMERSARSLPVNQMQGKVVVFGVGKASLSMYSGLRKSIGDRISDAVIITPKNQEKIGGYTELTQLQASHPVPDLTSVESSRIAIQKLKNLGKNDTVILLISGGASSLFEIPAEGITIDEVAFVTKTMMDNGSDIFSLNKVRKALSSVKGGKLIRTIVPAIVYMYIISDVPGDVEETIGSGPVSYSSVDRNEIKTIMERYLPSGTINNQSLLDNMNFDFPSRPEFKDVTSKVILRNSDFVDYISGFLERTGTRVLKLGSGLTGDTVSLSGFISESITKFRDTFGSPFWFVGGGESTVKLSGNGVGGRNQELALRFALQQREFPAAFMAVGTDGTDGNSDLAGAVISSNDIAGATASEITMALNNNDTSPFIKKYGLAIKTGPTGNNVSDIFAGFVGN